MKIITRSAVTAIVAATGLALSLVVVTAPALASTDDTYPLPTVRQSTFSDDLFVVSYSEGGQVSAEYLTCDQWARV
ncbi:hypothetical protein JT358_10000 [Micrococcales bacterium 31B]|nr:hypothetical protein [Micrococcales bacterium 31B]